MFGGLVISLGYTCQSIGIKMFFFPIVYFDYLTHGFDLKFLQR